MKRKEEEGREGEKGLDSLLNRTKSRMPHVRLVGNVTRSGLSLTPGYALMSISSATSCKRRPPLCTLNTARPNIQHGPPKNRSRTAFDWLLRFAHLQAPWLNIALPEHIREATTGPTRLRSRPDTRKSHYAH